MNTLPVPYTNSWQISNDSNSTDQNYIIQSWCSSTIYKHSENFAQKTINIVWLSWQKWIKIVWKFSRPMWNSSTNILSDWMTWRRCKTFSGPTFHCRVPGAFQAPPRPSVCWWGGCRCSADWPSRECWTTCVDLCHWAIYPPLERTNTQMNAPWDQKI